MEENKNINIQNNHQTNQEKNERNGRGLFYFVIAFAVIIIAVVGATYAYFTAFAVTDGNNEVTAASSKVELGIEVDRSGANSNLIPVSENIAKYAYAMQKTVTDTDECLAYETDELGSPTANCIKYKKSKNSTCIDDDGAEVCSTYTYTISSSNTSPQKLTMYLGTNENQFGNLWFAVYTNTGVDADGLPIRTRISEPQPVPKNSGDLIEITPIVVDGDAEQTAAFEAFAYPTLTAAEPKTYTIVLWIKDLDTDGNNDPNEGDDDDSDDDQTEVDGNGKYFRGYVKVESGNGTGVTGQIGNAGTEVWDDTIIGTTTTETTTPETTTPETTTPETTTTDPVTTPTTEPTT